MNDMMRNLAFTEVRGESEDSTAAAVNGCYCSCSAAIRSSDSTIDVSYRGTIAIKDLS